jgi:hypothetical protein
MSESKEDMQNQLNVFNDFCKKWKLKVNAEKSKVLERKGERFSPCRTPLLQSKKSDTALLYTILDFIF